METIIESQSVDTLTPIDKLLCLQNVDLFKCATTEMLAYIGSIAAEVRIPGGATIFSERESSDAMYVVVSGRVRLIKNDKEVLLVDEMGAFGTWALFDSEPRLMTAIAIEDVRLLKIGSESFYDLLADHGEITPVIFRAVIERVKSLIPDQPI